MSDTDMADDDERYVWRVAHGPGPCGCPYDADAMIDRETNRPVEWHCRVCGDHSPEPYDERDDNAQT